MNYALFYFSDLSALTIMNAETESRTNEYLKGIVANLPEKPGIYQYLNTEGTIIYVGKAKNLKKESTPISARNTSRERHGYLSARLPISVIS